MMLMGCTNTLKPVLAPNSMDTLWLQLIYPRTLDILRSGNLCYSYSTVPRAFQAIEDSEIKHVTKNGFLA